MSFGTTVQLTYGISDSLVVRQDFHWITGIRKSKLWCIYKSMCILTIFSSSVYTLHFALCPRDVGAHDSSICFLAGVASLWLCSWMQGFNKLCEVSIPFSKSISQLKIFLVSKNILPRKYIVPDIASVLLFKCNLEKEKNHKGKNR